MDKRKTSAKIGRQSAIQPANQDKVKQAIFNLAHEVRTQRMLTTVSITVLSICMCILHEKIAVTAKRDYSFLLRLILLTADSELPGTAQASGILPDILLFCRLSVLSGAAHLLLAHLAGRVPACFAWSAVRTPHVTYWTVMPYADLHAK